MSVTKINIFGIIGVDVFFKDIEKQMSEAKGDTIEVSIMSQGGSVDEGLAIYSLLKNSEKEVMTKGHGIVASIATVIFMGGHSVRELDEFTDFMIHNSRIAPDPNSYMEADQIKKLGEHAQLVEDKLTNFYAQTLNKPFDEINKLMDAETHFTGAQAVDYGFATGLLEKENKLKAVALYNPDNMKLFKNLFKAEAASLVVETEGGLKLFTDSEELAEGVSLWLADENGEKTDTAPDNGEHTLADGRVITVEDGKLMTITEAQAISDDEEEDEIAKRMSALENKVTETLEGIDAKVDGIVTAMGDQVDAQNTGIAEALLKMKAEAVTEAKASIEGTMTPPEGNESGTLNSQSVYKPSGIALAMKAKEEARIAKRNAN